MRIPIMKFRIKSKIEMKTRNKCGCVALLWMEILLHDFENQNEDDNSGDKGCSTARKRMEMTNQPKSWIDLRAFFYGNGWK